MTNNLCRWGILSTATIARKNWQAIRDAGNATLTAVASRSVDRSTTFIAECQASAPLPNKPDALGSYEHLLSRPDIDAVYIPLPTGLRKEWVIRAAEAGKHVLVEKPVGCTLADADDMIAACQRHNVQFMDGVMFMHNKRLPRVREILDAGREIGSIRHIASQFSFAGGDEFMRSNIRTHGTLEPLGCLGDLGWYCIRFTLWALNYQLPLQVTGRIHADVQQHSDAPSVPQEFSATLTFAGGVSASFYCSFTAANAQWATLSGTNGLLRIDDFVLPFAASSTRFSITRSEFVIDGCQFDMQEGRKEEVINVPSNNAQGSPEANMFHTFSDLVVTKKFDPRWPEITLQTQRVLDACLLSARLGSVPVEVTTLCD